MAHLRATLRSPLSLGFKVEPLGAKKTTRKSGHQKEAVILSEALCSGVGVPSDRSSSMEWESKDLHYDNHPLRKITSGERTMEEVEKYPWICRRTANPCEPVPFAIGVFAGETVASHLTHSESLVSTDHLH
jgi:hypothetical protein